MSILIFLQPCAKSTKSGVPVCVFCLDLGWQNGSLQKTPLFNNIICMGRRKMRIFFFYKSEAVKAVLYIVLLFDVRGHGYVCHYGKQIASQRGVGGPPPTVRRAHVIITTARAYRLIELSSACTFCLTTADTVMRVPHHGPVFRGGWILRSKSQGGVTLL